MKRYLALTLAMLMLLSICTVGAEGRQAIVESEAVEEAADAALAPDEIQREAAAQDSPISDASQSNAVEDDSAESAGIVGGAPSENSEAVASEGTAEGEGKIAQIEGDLPNNFALPPEASGEAEDLLHAAATDAPEDQNPLIADAPAVQAPDLTVALEKFGETSLRAIVAAEEAQGEVRLQWQRADAAAYADLLYAGDLDGAEALWRNIEGETGAELTAASGETDALYRCAATVGELRTVSKAERIAARQDIAAESATPGAEIAEAELVEEAAFSPLEPERASAEAAARPQSIALNAAEVTLARGKAFTIQATILPEGSSGAVTWACSDAEGALVSFDEGSGTVTALGDQGEVTITATLDSYREDLPDNPENALLRTSVTIHLARPLARDSKLEIRCKDVIAVGERVDAKVVLEEGACGAFTWSVDNSRYASVNSDTGAVKGVRAGTVTLAAAFVDDPEISVQKSIRVISAPSKLAFQRKTSKLAAGEEFDFAVRASKGYQPPAGIALDTSGMFAYASSNPSVVQVIQDARDGTATVKAHRKGSAKITAKSAVGKASVSVTVQVSDALERIDIPAVLDLLQGASATLTPAFAPKSASPNLAWRVEAEEGNLEEEAKLSCAVDGRGRAVVKANAAAQAGDRYRVIATAAGCEDAAGAPIAAACIVTVKQLPTVDGFGEIALEKNAIGVGETIRPSFTFAEDRDYAGKLSWSIDATSKRNKIAFVNASTGAITGKKASARPVTLTAKLNGHAVSRELCVINAPGSVKFEAAVGGALTMGVGETLTLGAVVAGYAPKAGTPEEYAANDQINNVYNFTSSRPEIVSVDARTGLLTAIASGTSTITLKTYNAAKKDARRKVALSVTVLPAARHLALDTSAGSELVEGEKLYLRARLNEGYGKPGYGELGYVKLEWECDAGEESGIHIRQLSNEVCEVSADAGTYRADVPLAFTVSVQASASSGASADLRDSCKLTVVSPPKQGKLTIDGSECKVGDNDNPVYGHYKDIIGVGETAPAIALALSNPNASVAQERVTPWRGRVKWYNKGSKIFSVNERGEIKGLRVGSAYLYCDALDANGAVIDTAKRYIHVINPVTSITLQSVFWGDKRLTSLNMGVGEVQDIHVELNGYHATAAQKRNFGGVDQSMRNTIFINSDNPDVIAIDASWRDTREFRIEAVGEGTATVTVTSYNGKKAALKVAVSKELESIRFDGDLKIAPGDSIVISADLGGADTRLKWDLDGSYPGCKLQKLTNTSAKLTAPGNATPGESVGIQVGAYFVNLYEPCQIKGTCSVAIAGKPAKGENFALELDHPTINAGKAAVARVVYTGGAAGSIASWSSSNRGIATVKNGVITGKRAGTVTITARAYNGATASCKLTVAAAPKSISFVNPIGNLSVGESCDLDVALPGFKLEGDAEKPLPEDGSIYAFSTSDANVIEVDAHTGVVRTAAGARAGQSATITARAYNKVSRKLTIKLQPTPQRIALNLSAAERMGGVVLNLNETRRFEAVVTDEYGQQCAANVRWSLRREDEAFASIDSSGLLKPLKPTRMRSIQVTARLYDGSAAEGGSLCDSVRVSIRVAPVGGSGGNMVLSAPKAKIGVGEIMKLRFHYSDDVPELDSEAVTVSGSNGRIASVTRKVDEEGETYYEIKGLKSSETNVTLTAKAPNGEKVAATIQVRAAPSRAAVSNAPKELAVGATCDVRATLSGYGGIVDAGSFLSAASSEPAVLEIAPKLDESGAWLPGWWTLKALQPGSARITIAPYRGSAASFAVEVR